MALSMSDSLAFGFVVFFGFALMDGFFFGGMFSAPLGRGGGEARPCSFRSCRSGEKVEASLGNCQAGLRLGHQLSFVCFIANYGPHWSREGLRHEFDIGFCLFQPLGSLSLLFDYGCLFGPKVQAWIWLEP
jgi:hypothetical protein